MIIGECTEPYKWQICLNADHPVVLGEFELVSHYQQLFAGQPFVCSNPTGLEVKTVDDREPSSTGDTFCFTLKEDERNGRCYILTTDINNTCLTMDQFLTNYTTSLPLRINNNGPFTFHYAVWPYVCLFAIIAIVWFFIYLSIIYTRHNRPKTELYRLSFICATQDTTIARTVGGGYETSIVISPLYV